MEKVIILFGKPGAGKGTRLSKFLKEGREEQFEVLSVGNLLRKAVKEQTKLGKRAKEYMDSGKLVPDEVINEIVIDGIKNANKTVFIDGFPRTIGQAEAMIKAEVYPTVIEFYVDDEVVIQRAKDRIVCSNCGEPYTTNSFKPPKTEGICDRCGGELVRRKDDDEQIVKNRLEVYNKETYPVLSFLKSKDISISTIGSDSEKAGELFEIIVLS